MSFFIGGSGASNISYKGNYDSNKSYKKNEVVIFQGSSYICLQPSKGTSPSNATYWGLLASSGNGSIVIDDSNTNTSSSTLSALMIKTLLDGKINDDESTSHTSTYSSSKIESLLHLKKTSEPEYVIKDAWTTFGIRSFSENMYKFNIANKGTSDIVVEINNISILVKESEAFEEIFDPYNQVIISGDGLFEAYASSILNSMTSPQYTVKDYFSDVKNTTRVYSDSVNGLTVANDGNSPLGVSVNGITLSVNAGEVVEQNFEDFTQVSINSSNAFRAYVKAKFQKSIVGNSIIDTTPPSEVTGLNTVNITHNSLTLSWIASTSLDASTYCIYQENNLISEVTGTTYTFLNLNSNTNYNFTIKVKDTSGIVSSGVSISAMTTSAPDTVPPVPVADLQVNNITQNGVSVVWAANQETDLKDYRVYANSTLMATVTTTSCILTGLLSGTNYTLTVRARDTSNNESESSVVTFTTLTDVVAPIVTALPNGGNFGESQLVTLYANEPATIYYTIDGSDPTTTSATYTEPFVISSTTELKIIGKDLQGNISSPTSVNFIINVIDTLPPQPVSNLQVGSVTANSIPISWTLSSSNDVSSYEVAFSENGVSYTILNSSISPSSTSYTVSGLSSNSSYTIRLIAVDASGNRSTEVTVQGTTAAAPDTTPPEVVTNLSSSNITQTSILVLWTGSISSDTAKYEVAYSKDGANYTVASNYISNTTTSYEITGLSPSTMYTIRVVAIDTSGNRSINSPTVNVSTTSFAEVTNVAISNVTSTTCHIGYLKSATAIGYEIYSNDSLITTTPSYNGVNGYTYDFSGLIPASTYKFKVVSVYPGGKSNGVTFMAAMKPTTTSTNDVIDTFSRPDQDILGITESGHYWFSPNLLSSPSAVNTSTLAIKDNQVYNKGGTTLSTSVTTNSKADNIRVAFDATIYKSTSQTAPNIIFRMSDINNYWSFGRSYGNLIISKVVNGTKTDVGTYVYNFNSVSLPHNLAVELRGNYFYCYMNDSLIFAISDDHNKSAQYHGLSIYGDAFAMVDNFKIIDITSTDAPSPDIAAPTEVSNVVGTPQSGGTSMKISWTGSQDAYSYVIYVNNTFNKTIYQIMNGGTTTQNYIITGLTASTLYNIRVTAKDGFGKETTGTTLALTTSAS